MKKKKMKKQLWPLAKPVKEKSSVNKAIPKNKFEAKTDIEQEHRRTEVLFY